MLQLGSEAVVGLLNGSAVLLGTALYPNGDLWTSRLALHGPRSLAAVHLAFSAY